MAALQATGTALQFVIVEKQRGRAIGTCVLLRFDQDSARAELGDVLGRPHRGRGFMREATESPIDFAFAELSPRRLEVEVEVDPKNEASTRLLRSLGFVREGVLHERWVVKGAATGVEIFGLSSRERAAR